MENCCILSLFHSFGHQGQVSVFNPEEMFEKDRSAAVGMPSSPTLLNESKVASEPSKHRIEVKKISLSPATQHKNKILLPTKNGFQVLPIRHILRCEAMENYTRFFLMEDKPIIVCKTLKNYETSLAIHGFFRIHKKHLINLHEVQAYVRGRGGVVVLSDQTELDVSRHRKEAFLQHMYQIHLL